MSKLLRVLIIEDSEDDAELLAIELKRGGYQVVHQRVDTKAKMQAALEISSWDIILADYSMPKFNAIAALEFLKQLQLDLPFVIVSGKIGKDIAVSAMRAGAHDYFKKSDLSCLIPAVERELKEAILREEGRTAREKLRYLAYYDRLTELPNRTLFLEHLGLEMNRSLELAEDRAYNSIAVLLLSIDRFRNIKHSLGYVISEHLLTAVARRLEQCITPIMASIVARIGEDEFALVILEVENSEDIFNRAEYLYQKLIEPFDINNTRICSTVSIGIALNRPRVKDPEKLLRWADTAMQYAKKNFVKTSVLFDETMQSKAVEKLQLENDLQWAIDSQQLYLNYQPIVSLSTGKTRCLEALIRWKHDSLGIILPNRFIPICEETGQIIALGEWVLSKACSQLTIWQKSLSDDSALTISINLSRIQIYHPELIPQIDLLLDSFNLKGKHLKLEITESILMENTLAVTKVLEQLKEREIQLCLDDFGTGYSALSYLRDFPFDILKIDRSFIGETRNYGIVRAIVDLAHELSLDVVAEGIETKEQLEILRELGCEYGQGYFFFRPLDEANVLNVLRGKLGND